MKQALIIIIALLSCGLLHAQPEAKNKTPRIVILLDGSSSMLHEWTKDDIRFEAAAKIIDKLMDSVYAVNKDVEFALRVYGHQSPTSANNCFDSKLEVMFSKDNYTQMMLRLEALHPLGISPIAYSIQQSAERDMPNLLDNKYSLILITDGGESCEGDICKTVELMLKKKIDFKPYIISLLDYAPLRAQYNCMGEYLLVTKPDDINPVVGKIVESYRHSFIQSTTTAKLLEVARKTPSALKVRTPDVKIVTPVIEQPLPETKAPVVTPPPAKKDTVVPKPIIPKRDTVIPKPAERKPDPVIQAPQRTTQQVPVTTPVAPPAPKPVKPSNIVVVNEGLEKQKEDVRFIAAARKRNLPVIYASNNPRYIKVPAPMMIVLEVEAPPKPKETIYKPMATATMVKSPVAAPKQPELKILDYKVVEREESKETTLEIFLTDGKGKYYETAPELVLRDMKTNDVVHKFYRDVDAYGKPRPQKGVPAGTYNITVTGKNGMVWQAVEIREKNKNKYELIVTKGSLTFSYNYNPTRPVTEFSARVSVAIKRNAVNKQLCSEVIAYEPENYHIEINTNPITVKNADVGLGELVYLALDEPGQLKVMNPKNYKKITFLYQHGDRYEDFIPTNVKGNISQQEFLIQPGRYKIAYIQNELVPDPRPIVKDFIVKSNTVTELTLD